MGHLARHRIPISTKNGVILDRCFLLLIAQMGYRNEQMLMSTYISTSSENDKTYHTCDKEKHDRVGEVARGCFVFLVMLFGVH